MGYEAKYRVVPTKTGIRDGNKLPISEDEKAAIIAELKQLKYWPANESNFSYEGAAGLIEFKFNVKDHWIRSFVYQDDSRRTMWVCKVLAKKQNKLTNAEVAVLTAIYKAKALEEKEFNKKH